MPSRQRSYRHASIALLVLAGSTLPAQTTVPSTTPPPAAAWSSHLVVPQARAYCGVGREPIAITAVEAAVSILEQVATTTIDIALRNNSGSRQEAELVVPVPDGAVVRGFTFQGTASEPTARVLPRAEAHRVYDEIVARVRDPGLLEFAGYSLVRTSLFPVEARGEQKVRLTYEHILEADGPRIDYFLPRSESLEYTVPWKVTLKIESRAPISTVYSPSHPLDVLRLGAGVLAASLASATTVAPGPFRLSYLVEASDVTASMIAYPDPSIGGGYFLLLAGLPAKAKGGAGAQAIQRDVILVLDRSGSMAGEKFEQARQAAIQVIAALEPGEAFNILVYSDVVDLFSPEPVAKTDETMNRALSYLKSQRTLSGTNIHDALLEALRQKPAPGRLPIVLFLTDGLPTVGQTSERAIREVATKQNPHNRRIFTFGVGFDVNTPLLENIAADTRAAATFVLPRENVEVKIAGVFKRLSGPILASPSLGVIDIGAPAGRLMPSRVREVMPPKLPDLFDGDQLVVLGQYTGSEPIGFVVSGNYLGSERTFRFQFGLEKASTRHAFVPRLWASRKIAFLVDAMRQLGADGTHATVSSAAIPDPRARELVDEIVRLSTEFGILTEYTAFLAREGTDLTKKNLIVSEAAGNLMRRAVTCRTGAASVNQELNVVAQKEQRYLNTANSYVDENLNRVSVAAVQQVNDLAFYKRGDRWVDSRALRGEARLEPKRVIEFGSDEFRALARRLADENRQGCIALRGDILLLVGGEQVLVRAPR